MKTFFNLRARSGQFYSRKQFIHNQKIGRLAFACFLSLMVISCFFEVIANILIK